MKHLEWWALRVTEAAVLFAAMLLLVVLIKQYSSL